MKNLKKAIRYVLSKWGLVLWKRDFLKFGMDPFPDIARIGAALACPVETVFDVGANAGQFYREVSMAMPEAVVHSFEPHPMTYAELAKIVTAPSRCHQLALSDVCGTVPFYLYEGNSFISSLTPDAGFALRDGHKPRVIAVESITLDDFCAKEGIEQIGLLKVDVEGFDLAVLMGGKRMFIENRVQFVFVEFNNLLETEGAVGGDLVPIAQFLATYGLHCVATYTDYVTMGRPLWGVSNALFFNDCGTPGADDHAAPSANRLRHVT